MTADHKYIKIVSNIRYNQKVNDMTKPKAQVKS